MQLISFLNSLFKKEGFVLIDANSKKYIIGNPQKNKPLTLKLLKKNLHFKLLINPDLYFGEAYMDGSLVIENGSLTEFLEIAFKNIGRNEINNYGYLLKKIKGTYRYLTNFNFAKKSKKNVAHHYDLNEELYRLFLDKDMQYSCGYFYNDNISLDQSQIDKKNHIIKKLKIEKNMSVLDIGCGWGGLALQIAKETGAKVKGITLSENQLNTAKKRAEAEGLSDRVEFALQDYRQEQHRYDRIVSIGMFEHVGVKYFSEFFSKTIHLLNESGIFLLHTIGQRGKPSSTDPWIRKYIFPGGYIPSLSEILKVCEKQNINITDIEVLRLHYARTLKHWYSNFLKNKSSIIKMFDERFFRMWEYYLLSSQYSFLNLGNVVFQIQISKKINNLPLTRDYMYN